MNDRLVPALLDERDRRNRAEDELARLRRRVEILDRKLVELSGPAHLSPALRHAYRRGYCTGYHAGRARADRLEAPEQVARGALGRAMREGLDP